MRPAKEIALDSEKTPLKKSQQNLCPTLQPTALGEHQYLARGEGLFAGPLALLTELSERTWTKVLFVCVVELPEMCKKELLLMGLWI